MTICYNAVPKAWASSDCYKQLLPQDDKKCDVFYISPRIGAFEISYKGFVIFSKLNSQLWPHVPTVTD